MNKLKNYIIGILVFLCTISFSFGAFQLSQLRSTRAELDIAQSNYKAYEVLYSQAKEDNRVFKLTVDQLSYSKDSLVQRLDSVKRANKALNKKVKALAYLESQAHIIDTIRLRDTLFVKDMPPVDTTIQNKWYQVGLHLSYPNEVGIDMKVNSEKYLMVSSKRETVMPPKKCWFARLFQKKHTVLEVEVHEENPYIENGKQRFIEIIN